MPIVLRTLATITALAATATPAFAWDGPRCGNVGNDGMRLCLVSQAFSGGRSGAEQTLDIAVVQYPGGQPFAVVSIKDDAWSMPDRTCATTRAGATPRLSARPARPASTG
jgi:hypothetical protein